MQGSDFSKVRVGDRIWNLFQRNWWEVVNIFFGSCYPIKLRNEFGNSDSCTMDGKVLKDDKTSTYFWDEIKFEIPPPPKRMVKKTIKVWARMSGICKGEINGITADEYTADTWIYKEGYRVEEFSKEIEVEE